VKVILFSSEKVGGCEKGWLLHSVAMTIPSF